MNIANALAVKSMIPPIPKGASDAVEESCWNFNLAKFKSLPILTGYSHLELNFKALLVEGPNGLGTLPHVHR